MNKVQFHGICHSVFQFRPHRETLVQFLLWFAAKCVTFMTFSFVLCYFLAYFELISRVISLSLKPEGLEKNLSFPMQVKVKPIFPIQNAPRTRHSHDDGLYLVNPLFSWTEFFEILAIDFSFRPAFV